MRLRNFPSYRLRHAIRVWRYKRPHPWQFIDGNEVQPKDYKEGCAASASSRFIGKRVRHHDHPRSVLVASFVVVMMVAPGVATASQFDELPVTRTSTSGIGQESWRLLQATNASRERFDLPPLRLNRELSEIARQHSVAMARVGALFHTPDIGVYLRAIDWRTWGENVGYTPRDVGSVQTAFMASPTHREHILNDAFRHVAIGSVRMDGTLWVTIFFYG